ncbi:MAG: hypothetical protein GF388_02410 [Candidatus Aegiribacteria sp.]|nr:hypothetical protein [Candidatus Aegiribacteria sp.]MBD3294169.1 hypothetical protein [Candidatus Fermentibacteria bacterium]
MTDGRSEDITVRLHPRTLDLLHVTDSPPRWAELDFNKCPNCTLDSARHPYCPLCLAIREIVDDFSHVLSYDRLHLKVITDDRIVSQRTSAQQALSSLMGLLIATSGCPRTSFFKPMARFHLPLASRDETVYRAVSTYLLAQYYIEENGQKADFHLKGLKEIYQNVQVVNEHVVRRLRSVSEEDSPVNAIVILDTYAQTVPMVIGESLENLRHMFSVYTHHDPGSRSI